MAIPIVRQDIKQASLIIAIIAISSQGLGLLREMIIANFLGTSAEYDILLISMAIPLMVGSILFLAIPSAGIPFLQEQRKDSGLDYSIIKSSFLKVNTVVTLIISLIIFFLLPDICRLFMPGLEQSKLDTVIMYSRFFCLAIPFRTYEGVFRSLLHLNKNFLFPALTMLGFNIIVILILITLFPNIGSPAYIMAWLLGLLAQLLIVAIPSFILFNKGKRNSRISHFNSSGFLKYFGIIILVESVGLVIDPFDRYLAGNMLSSGYVSANSYAIVLSMAPIRILIFSMGTAIFPSLTEHISEGRSDKSTALYHKAIAVCVMLVFPVAIYLIMFSNEIVSLLFERGKFGVESRIMTVEVLKYYLMGIIFPAAFYIQLRVLYALRSWRHLVLVRILSLIAKCLIGIFFIKYNWALAIGGGTVAMFIISFGLMEVYLVTRGKLRYSRVDVILIGKGFICAAVSITLFQVTNLIGGEFLSAVPLVNLAMVGIIGFGGLLLMDGWLKVSGLSFKNLGLRR
jgi:putative peptidoglycan lipid II flippase